MIVLDGPLSGWRPQEPPASVTIGVLDGVHRGHRALLARLDGDMRRTVLTFDPHPLEVLRPGASPRLITTVGERVELLDDAGVECVGILDLSEIKNQAPDKFVADVLLGKMGARQVVVGADFRFGKDRSGDVTLLQEMAEELGFCVDPIELVDELGSPISSSRIRGLIESGHLDEAADLLGSRFRLTGTVIDGDKRGRDIGFPTANLKPPARKLIPAIGVYACFATIEEEDWLPAAVNVGVRPTFGGEELVIEAYILDFEADLYGKRLTLEFVDYLRPEVEFDGVGPLVAQMSDDVAQARDILSRTTR